MISFYRDMAVNVKMNEKTMTLCSLQMAASVIFTDKNKTSATAVMNDHVIESQSQAN